MRYTVTRISEIEGLGLLYDLKDDKGCSFSFLGTFERPFPLPDAGSTCVPKEGTLACNDGRAYSGTFRKGLPNGESLEIRYANGDYYCGGVVNFIRCGDGTLISHDDGKQMIYCGQFVDDLPHGEGELMIDGVIKYSGKFLDGFPIKNFAQILQDGTSETHPSLQIFQPQASQLDSQNQLHDHR